VCWDGERFFLSGGVFSPETRARLDELGAVQLEKPVSAQQLREAVRSATDGAAAPPVRAAAQVAPAAPPPG
jgi:hypothetical protein